MKQCEIHKKNKKKEQSQNTNSKMHSNAMQRSTQAPLLSIFPFHLLTISFFKVAHTTGLQLDDSLELGVTVEDVHDLDLTLTSKHINIRLWIVRAGMDICISVFIRHGMKSSTR